jgi:hypothetical protein
VIFFQGEEDAVVPPNQTEVMVEALRRKGNAVAYFLFAGEQHGFRKAATIQRCLDAELYFYATEVFRVGLSFEHRRNENAGIRRGDACVALWPQRRMSRQGEACLAPTCVIVRACGRSSITGGWMWHGPASGSRPEITGCSA